MAQLLHAEAQAIAGLVAWTDENSTLDMGLIKHRLAWFVVEADYVNDRVATTKATIHAMDGDNTLVGQVTATLRLSCCQPAKLLSFKVTPEGS